MFITLFFILMTTIIILLQKQREKNYVNLMSILMAPYTILVFLNNFLFYRFGFYKISDNVLIMFLFSFILFYIGALPFNMKSSILNKESDNIKKFSNYNMRFMIIFLYMIGIIGLIKIFILILDGQFSDINIDSAEGIMGSGIFGHLLILSYSVLPIVFLYWSYTKKIKHLFPVLLLMIVSFSSLVKYHIIGLIVTNFIFLMMYKKSILKKSIFYLIIFVILVFMANYGITFFIKGATPPFSFYLRHLWSYMSGSLIYDNYIFTYGIRTETNILYKLGTFLCALPNMFLRKFFGIILFTHIRQDDLLIGYFGETSNVVDAIGYIFPSKGSIFDIFIFGIFILFIGFIFSLIYIRNIKKDEKFNTFIANFLCYFVFFSFFGTFYISSGPWEILVYSAIIPNCFLKNRRFIYGGNICSK